MKFYVDEEFLNRMKNPKWNNDCELIFLYPDWNTLSSYEITVKYRKIDKRPIKIKLKEAYNRLVAKLKWR